MKLGGWALGAAWGASVLLHAAWLSPVVLLPRQAMQANPGTQGMQVRLASPAAAQHAEAQTTTATLVLPMDRGVQPDRAERAHTQPTPADAASAHTEAVNTPAESLPGLARFDLEYTPLSAELDQPAQLVSDLGMAVSLSAEPTQEPGGSAIYFTLLIDETGRVLDAVADPTHTPEDFVAQLRTTLMEARFSPGLQNGQPVRSLLRVQVIFDGTSPDARVQP